MEPLTLAMTVTDLKSTILSYASDLDLHCYIIFCDGSYSNYK